MLPGWGKGGMAAEEGLSPHNLSLALDRKVTPDQWGGKCFLNGSFFKNSGRVKLAQSFQYKKYTQATHTHHA